MFKIAQLAGHLFGAASATVSAFGVAARSRLQYFETLGWLCKARMRRRVHRGLSFGIFLPGAGRRDRDETSARGELHVVDCTGLPRLGSG